MKAVQITTLDGPDAITVGHVPAPVAGDGQVLIDVRAAGVAFPEVLQTRGEYQIKPDLPFVPGAEVAGDVISAPESSGLSPGDRVCALTMLGGFAEQAVADAQVTFALPDGVEYEAGASFLFNYCTAYFALVERGRLSAGETVLVHGAAGGVGTASIQMAKAFGAARVIAVTSTDQKGDIAVQAGADEYVLAEGFKDEVKSAGGADVIVDPVGGDRFTDSLRSLKEAGRLLVIGFTGGEIPTVKVNRLLLNNIEVVGVGWGAYALSRPGHIATEWQAMKPHLASGALRPVVGPRFALDDGAEALRTIDQRRATGKVLLTP